MLQGKHDPDEGYCLNSACCEAASGTDGWHAAEYYKATTLLARRLPEEHRKAVPVGGQIADWNDQPDRTEGEVMALIDKALNHV